jgi:signal transduction histidine kinase
VREVFPLGTLAAEVAELATPLAAGRGVSIAVEAAGDARADREQLRRAVVNLVRNALEVAPPGSEVELSASAGVEEAAVEVRDRGPGLTPEARASLFQPFFTTKERGTGLGLALAKKVADAHGGRLTLEDRPGGGTTARLQVPTSGGRSQRT